MKKWTDDIDIEVGDGVMNIVAADVKIMSEPELQLLAQIVQAQLPTPRFGKSQWRFHPRRGWRADFAWPGHGLAGVIVEVEGGTWTQGRHTRGAGFEEDCIKYDEAALAGITVLRVTPAMIDDGRALEYIKRALFPGER